MRVDQKKALQMANLCAEAFEKVYNDLTSEPVTVPMGGQSVEVDKLKLHADIDTLITLLKQAKNIADYREKGSHSSKIHSNNDFKYDAIS